MTTAVSRMSFAVSGMSLAVMGIRVVVSRIIGAVACRWIYVSGRETQKIGIAAPVARIILSVMRQTCTTEATADINLFFGG